MKRSLTSILVLSLMASALLLVSGCAVELRGRTVVGIDGGYGGGYDQPYYGPARILLYNVGTKRNIYSFTITENKSSGAWEIAGSPFVLDAGIALPVDLDYGSTYSVLVRATDASGRKGAKEAARGPFTIAGDPSQEDGLDNWYYQVVRVD